MVNVDVINDDSVAALYQRLSALLGEEGGSKDAGVLCE